LISQSFLEALLIFIQIFISQIKFISLYYE
jgi:hypothetical protein